MGKSAIKKRSIRRAKRRAIKNRGRRKIQVAVRHRLEEGKRKAEAAALSEAAASVGDVHFLFGEPDAECAHCRALGLV